MSWWTYAKGWVQVSVPGRTQEEKDYIIKTVLNHLPIVRGSEEEMYVHMFKAGGHNQTDFEDEYGERTNNLEHWIYKGCKSQKDGCLRTQGEYYIFIEGHFRDTYYGKQYRQLIKWLTRLGKRLYIDEVDILFSDRYKSSCRINDDFSDVFVWENNWCDHLMWKDAPPKGV